MTSVGSVGIGLIEDTTAMEVEWGQLELVNKMKMKLNKICLIVCGRHPEDS